MIARRLRGAAEEIRDYKIYDYVLVNRVVEESVDTLVSIVKATRSRRDRMEEQIRPISGDVFVGLALARELRTERPSTCPSLISEIPPPA